MKVNILLNLIMDFVKMGWGTWCWDKSTKLHYFAYVYGGHCCTFGDILDVHPPGMIGQVNQPLVGVNRTSSSLSNFPMLCSTLG